VVLATVRPPLRLRIERNLQGHQHAIAIRHDVFVGKPDDAKAELAKHSPVAGEVEFAFVRVTVNLDRQPSCRTEEVNDAEADHVLTAEFVPEALSGTQSGPQAFFRFGRVIAHVSSASKQDFAGDATTPNPLL
jgi:hypothetical protein